MSNISAVFKSGHKALVPYITVGYPDIETTIEAAVLLARSGCDIIELGIPFSDPLADGATIQKASYHALKNGVNLEKCLETARNISDRIKNTPLVFMGYYNPILQYGLKEFCHSAKYAGVDGLIIPDLPPEEGVELEEQTRGRGMVLIYLLSPASSDRRISMVVSKGNGFIYLVSITGVTGARENLPQELEEFVGRVRAKTELPLCVGFGISSSEQARRVAKVADGIIVGSRIIQLIEEDKSLASLQSFTIGLRKALG
ncbi:MAG: tryptophan synthase subunit alpha [Dehalococcoidales bacterium]